MKRVRSLARPLNRLSLPLTLVGIGMVCLHNWRLWQRDQQMLTQRTPSPPLPPLEDWPRLPLVSAMVAAWNEADHIEQHIQSFLALRYPHKELILCAGGTDQTYHLALRYAGEQVKVLEQQPGEGKQRALCRCLPYTQGTIVVLTDADCLFTDDWFERTIFPVAREKETVTTGSSQPHSQHMSSPFVIAQAATQSYTALYSSDYTAGILGRNCALQRLTLEQSHGLEAPAFSGTDYVLAKMLHRYGASIRHIPESRTPTEYPTTIHGYIRQQRRWLRNVALHGQRFGAYDEVVRALRTSLVGLGMLVAPLLALRIGPVIIVAWLTLLMHAFLSRWRYLLCASRLLNIPLSGRQVCLQFPMIFLDCLAWSAPLLDYLPHARRWRW